MSIDNLKPTEMKKIRLEKIQELQDALHPNNIEVGHVKEGNFIARPEIDKPFYIGGWWRTSVVTEILDDHTFKTRNSIYKWSVID